ncbi:MAG: hypothetical protein FJ312_02175 [SAR202 cluster bacterium]|nr:hypothetical protein [SAR202 cluster bacterium]
MAKLAFVDTHIHFWDLSHPDLYYAWLQPNTDHPHLGKRVAELSSKDYQAEDYVRETHKSNVVAAIHVQAALGIKDPVKETQWLQEAADRTGCPKGIVAYANLKDPRVEEVLERHCRYSNMRGIRDFSEGDYLVDRAFHRGYALLEKFRLASSMDVKWENMHKARDLARKFPRTAMVLDHCGLPVARTKEYFEAWKKGIATLAQAENVVCKISGLGIYDQNWTVESIRPWVLSCVETFGPKRCIFATNWPVDKLFSTYDALIDAYARIIADFTPDEKMDMFSRNALSLYRIKA